MIYQDSIWDDSDIPHLFPHEMVKITPRLIIPGAHKTTAFHYFKEICQVWTTDIYFGELLTGVDMIIMESLKEFLWPLRSYSSQCLLKYLMYQINFKLSIPQYETWRTFTTTTNSQVSMTKKSQPENRQQGAKRVLQKLWKIITGPTVQSWYC